MENYWSFVRPAAAFTFRTHCVHSLVLYRGIGLAVSGLHLLSSIEFMVTVMDDAAIAIAANMGFSNKPKGG